MQSAGCRPNAPARPATLCPCGAGRLPGARNRHPARVLVREWIVLAPRLQWPARRQRTRVAEAKRPGVSWHLLAKKSVWEKISADFIGRTARLIRRETRDALVDPVELDWPLYGLCQAG